MLGTHPPLIGFVPEKPWRCWGFGPVVRRAWTTPVARRSDGAGGRYQIRIRHQFELGGFDVKAGPGIDLDPMGLEWMRTLELSSRTTGIEYRMILFDDLDVILPGFPGPSPEMLKKMYGNRIGGTHLQRD